MCSFWWGVNSFVADSVSIVVFSRNLLDFMVLCEISRNRTLPLRTSDWHSIIFTPDFVSTRLILAWVKSLFGHTTDLLMFIAMLVCFLILNLLVWSLLPLIFHNYFHQRVLYIFPFGLRTHIRCYWLVKIDATTDRFFGFNAILALFSFHFIFCFLCSSSRL